MDKNNLLKNITSRNLEQWAGSTIFSRGKDYQEKGQVSQLSQIAEGGVVAWVSGSEMYLTQISLNQDKLNSACTCPYDGGVCKHAVAVVLEYQKQVKKGKNISTVAKEDIGLIYNNPYAELDSNYTTKKLKTLLQAKTKEELVDLLIDLARNSIEVSKILRDRYYVATGNANQLLKSIRCDVLGMQNSYYNDDYHYRDSVYDESDFKIIYQRLEQLIKQGYIDEVIDLAKEILEAGTQRVEMEEEKKSSENIAQCLKVIFQALPQSSLSTVNQMLWMHDLEQKDHYDLCSEKDVFWERTFKLSEWSEYADKLIKRIDKPINDSESYKRQREIEDVVDALEKARRTAEIIPLYQRQIAYGCNCYINLVNALKESGEIEESIKWIKKGFALQEGGTATLLYNMFEGIQESLGNFAQVAALKAESFFHSPSFNRYIELEKASQRIGVFPKVRECVLDFLETEKLPTVGGTEWPLSEPILKMKKPALFSKEEVLIDIAIYEKRNDDVVLLYEKVKTQGIQGQNTRYFMVDDNKIAHAIADTHTNKAVDIWKRKAESLVNQVTVSAYEKSSEYLCKIRDVLKRHNRESEWLAYKQNLRQHHIKKPRFQEIMDKIY